MKKLLYPVLLLLLLSSCKKDLGPDEVTYEVTLVNSDPWNVYFTDENFQLKTVTGVRSNWQYSFKNTNNVCCTHLEVHYDGLNNNPEAYMKIYVNGKVVASGKYSVFPNVMYTFP